MRFAAHETIATEKQLVSETQVVMRHSSKSTTDSTASSSLPSVARHAQDLHHSDEDVDEVKLETNALVHDISSHSTSLCHSCVVEDLLDIVECETTEDDKTWNVLASFRLEPPELTHLRTATSSL